MCKNHPFPFLFHSGSQKRNGVHERRAGFLRRYSARFPQDERIPNLLVLKGPRFVTIHFPSGDLAKTSLPVFAHGVHAGSSVDEESAPLPPAYAPSSTATEYGSPARQECA